MSFIVCSKNTTVFRAHIQNFKIGLEHPDANIQSVTFRGNFDNYRTIVAPSQPCRDGLVCFDNFEALFVYETVLPEPELLVAKLFALDVTATYASTSVDLDPFLGQCSVDLLTLAAGPSNVSLTIFYGDRPVGRMSFTIAFHDLTDSHLFLPRLRVECMDDGGSSSNAGGAVPLSQLRLRWLPVGCHDDTGAPDAAKSIDFTVCDADAGDPSKGYLYSRHPHNVCLTLQNLYSGAGVRFEASIAGLLFDTDIGHATVIFGDRIKDLAADGQRMSTAIGFTQAAREAQRLKELSDPAPPATILHLPPPPPGGDESNHTAAPSSAATSGATPAADDTMTFEKVLDFSVETSGGAEDKKKLRLRLSGRLYISKLPVFAQQKGGITVDGVACGGVSVPGALIIRPPFTNLGEESSV